MDQPQPETPDEPLLSVSATPLWVGLWDDLRLAGSFLTRLPIPAPAVIGEGQLARSMRVFPAIGALVGALAGLVFWGAHLALPPLVAALLAIATLALLTGALHEDGLADVADGFGGGKDRESKLAIMRDSRIGSYGVVALLLVLGMRVAALAALPGLSGLGALVAAGAVSRAAIPMVMRLSEPARPEGLGRMAGVPEPIVPLFAFWLALMAAVAGLGLPRAGLALLAAGLVTLTMVWLARRMIGGYTGDVLGATQELAETAVLVVACAGLAA